MNPAEGRAQLRAAAGTRVLREGGGGRLDEGWPAMKPVSRDETWRSEAAGTRAVRRPVVGPGDSPGLGAV